MRTTVGALGAVLAFGLACTGAATDTATDTPTDEATDAAQPEPEPEPEPEEPDRGKRGKGRKGGGREGDDDDGGGRRGGGGGCTVSKVFASTALSGHEADKATDGDDHTAWCEAETGFGTGERLTLEFGNGCAPATLTVLGGDFTSEATLAQNSRIERIMVTNNAGNEVVFNLPDPKNEPFDKAIGNPKLLELPATFRDAKSLTVRIDAVYPGGRGAAACISSVEVN